MIAENYFGRRLHPSYGAVQLIEGWEGTKVAGGDLQEEQEENFMEEQEEIYRRNRRRYAGVAEGDLQLEQEKNLVEEQEEQKENLQ